MNSSDVDKSQKYNAEHQVQVTIECMRYDAIYIMFIDMFRSLHNSAAYELLSDAHIGSKCVRLYSG